VFCSSLSFIFSVISSSIHLLVQDLENACEPALTAMVKVRTLNIIDFLRQYVLQMVLSLEGQNFPLRVLAKL